MNLEEGNGAALADEPLANAAEDDKQQQRSAGLSLHGLERNMSVINHEGGANFTDYLNAQKQVLHHHANGSPDRNRDSVASAEANRNKTNHNNSISAKATPEERKTMKRISLIGRRTSMAQPRVNFANTPSQNLAWSQVFHELEAIDEDGHFHDDQDHQIPWYSPPLQRQRWGQDQILPHINWGDLFFDLFYVAAAYNLGVMLISGLNPQDWPRGVLYFVGIFGPLYHTWETATYYESRYVTLDYAHRLFEIIRFLFVSVAVLHIEPLELLSDPKSLDALLFTSSIFCESLMHLGLNCELYFKGQGDIVAIKNHTLAKMKYQILPTTLMFLAATTVAGVQFAQASNDDYSGRLLAADDQPTPRWIKSDLPLSLTALAYLLNIVHTTWRKSRATSGKHGDIRIRFVPYNIDYVIHRYGEWIMLMIGESILSLLIVETTDLISYYTITTFGVLSVTLLMILKFESSPNSAEDHALWGNLLNGMCYNYLVQVLSMALIAFGVCFKVFLKDVLKNEKKDEAYGYGEDKQGRALAPDVTITEEATAALFTGSLSVVLVSLELMILTHNGWRKAVRRLLHARRGEHEARTETNKRFNIPMIMIVFVKLAVILFTVTLNRWTTDPTILTLCGFAIIATLALTRVFGWAYIYHKKKIQNATKSMRQKLAKTVSFGGPASLSESGREALGSQKKSSDASTTTRDTDVLSGGIDDSFDAIIVADLKGNIKKLNSTALQMFGYHTKDEMIGKNLSILVGGGQAKNHDGYMRRFRTKGGSRTSKVLGKSRVLQARKADGTEFPVIIGIKLCANGTRIVGYLRDMSGVVGNERMKMKAGLKVEEAIDRVLDDHHFDAVLVSDQHGVIHRVNERAVTEFAYSSKEEMVGLHISTIMHSLEDPVELLESHGEQHLVTLTDKDGTNFDSIVATTPIRGADGMVATYIRNIVPLKRSLSQRSMKYDK